MNRTLRSALYYGLLGILAVAYLVPVTWVVSTSLRTEANLLRPDQWIPNPVTLEHYTSGLYEALPNLGRYTFNTLRISILSTVGMLLSCSLAGYALARWRFPLRNLWFFRAAGDDDGAGTCDPDPDLCSIPQTRLAEHAESLDHSGFLRQPLRHLLLPAILPEFSARAGGRGDAGRRGRAAHICRHCRSGVEAGICRLGRAAFYRQSWNGFFLPIIYLTRKDQWVLTQAIRSMLGRYDSPWGEIMAGVVLMTLPIIALYMLVQRYFVQGITFTGIRG